MYDTGFIPVCIHNITKLRGVAEGDYPGVMYILKRTAYNSMTVISEWEKITQLKGYESGLVIDNSGVAKNFMDTIFANCYKNI